MRLFILDDSELLRSRLVDIFSNVEGISIVGQEGDVRKAVEAIKKLKPDLVIMDIRIQGGNGISALEIVKGIENPPIVIMFTNFPYLQYRKRCMDLGADHFFYKATEFENLIKLIEHYGRKKESF